jgi:glycosyltransferase involved in cell wall biosynthesis
MPGGPAAEQSKVALQALAAIIASDGAEPTSPAAADALARAVDIVPEPAWPEGLSAHPCPLPAGRWHLERLLAITSDDAAGRARRVYRARILAHLLAPQDPRFRPLVTILIPVFNRAAACAQAVESCLAQSWRPIEVLVVDDGSTDDLRQRLLPFGDAVRVLRKANGGVSSARNMGIAMARGDLIHFLDSDNLLRPDAVARKVEALAAIGDAELCYSTSEDLDFPPEAAVIIPPPSANSTCPTTDLMSTIARRYPFTVSTVMLPRWVAMEAGRFEEDLKRGEDWRYWIALALRGTKVVGLRQQLTIRRYSHRGLAATGTHDRAGRHLARLRDLRDVLAHVRGWPFAARFLRPLAGLDRKRMAALDDDAPIRMASAELLSVLRRLAMEGSCDGLSALPLAVALRDELRRLRAAGRSLPDRLRDDVMQLLAAMIRNGAPVAPADIAFWSMTSAKTADLHPIHRGMRAVLRHCASDPAALDAVSWLMRRCGHAPDRRAIRVLAVLRKRLRSIFLARTGALLVCGAQRPRARSSRPGTRI